MYETTKINPTEKKGGNNAECSSEWQWCSWEEHLSLHWSLGLPWFVNMYIYNGTVKTGKEDVWKTRSQHPMSLFFYPTCNLGFPVSFQKLLKEKHFACSHAHKPYFYLYLSISARFSSLLNWLLIHHYGSVWDNDQALQSVWNNFLWKVLDTFSCFKIYNFIGLQQKENIMLQQLPQWKQSTITMSENCHNIITIS